MQRKRRLPKKYWSTCQKLYGDTNQLNLEMSKETQPTRKKVGLRLPKEQEEQFVAVAWLKRMGIPHHHSPNGGSRDIREASKFKRLGVSPGFPDLFIPKAR